VDVHDKLDEITRYVEEARAMPMSASALVNRAELLVLLDELRELLPEELHNADLLLSDREAVVEQGRAQAEQLMLAAQAEHDRLVEQTEVVQSARQRAAQVQTQAQAEATRLLSEADDYVDRKLGEFEITLDKLVQQVQRGRQHLSERAATDRAQGLTADADVAVAEEAVAAAAAAAGADDADTP
jgi:thiamine biosynthesis lipoprotein ApbE